MILFYVFTLSSIMKFYSSLTLLPKALPLERISTSGFIDGSKLGLAGKGSFKGRKVSGELFLSDYEQGPQLSTKKRNNFLAPGMNYGGGSTDFSRLKSKNIHIGSKKKVPLEAVAASYMATGVDGGLIAATQYFKIKMKQQNRLLKTLNKRIINILSTMREKGGEFKQIKI
ncbi:expressed protein, partial [Phakopsora pachyrhizi]